MEIVGSEISNKFMTYALMLPFLFDLSCSIGNYPAQILFLSATASLELGGTNVSLYKQIVTLSLKIFFFFLQHKSDELYPRCTACSSPLPTSQLHYFHVQIRDVLLGEVAWVGALIEEHVSPTGRRSTAPTALSSFRFIKLFLLK